MAKKTTARTTAKKTTKKSVKRAAKAPANTNFVIVSLLAVAVFVITYSLTTFVGSGSIKNLRGETVSGQVIAQSIQEDFVAPISYTLNLSADFSKRLSLNTFFLAADIASPMNDLLAIITEPTAVYGSEVLVKINNMPTPGRPTLVFKQVTTPPTIDLESVVANASGTVKYRLASYYSDFDQTKRPVSMFAGLEHNLDSKVLGAYSNR